MKIENLLEMLVSSKYDELRIEPDAEPFFETSNGRINAAGLTMTAPIISSVVFPVIPDIEKSRLPNVPQIAFDLSHKLGTFNFVVTKSSAGLNVAIKQTESAPQPVNNASLNLIMTTAEPAKPIAPANVQLPSNNSNLPLRETNSVKQSSVVKEPFKNSNETEKVEENELVQKPKSLFSSLQSVFLSGNKKQVDDSEIEDDVELDEFLSESDYSPEPISFPKPQSQPVQNGNVNHNSSEQRRVAPVVVNGAVKSRMDALFHQMAEMKASDLHMSVSMPPMVRKDGKMMEIEGSHERLTPESMRELLTSIMPEKNREEFERRHDTDFAYEISGLARFRANIFMDRKGMGGVFRIIPTKILSAEALGLSSSVLDLCNLSKGLVVVTGPTGSGKSTTLCAMVDHINHSREDHIITIEDPIEFVHENQSCLVNQREVHNHTDSFKDALRAALREDPDILLVGEMRDLETISIAIETAETGHLVFGTLHTTTAASTVDRIIDQFPADRQQQIRVMLSESLKGVIAQTLLPKKGGGRVAAMEILIVTPAISNLIREGKTFQITSAMQTGKAHGMVVLNDALVNLVEKGLVEPRDAYIKAVDKAGFESAYKRLGHSTKNFESIK